MSEHSIILQGWGVRASFDGTKTMTRRLPGCTNSTVDGRRVSPKFWKTLDLSKATIDRGGTELFGSGPYLHIPTFDGETWHRVRPLYRKGDVLWVRETWNNSHDGYVYRADAGNAPEYVWRPSIFMPKESSRLFLEVLENPWPEHIQDISEEDARAEGVETTFHFHRAATSRFVELWDSINAKRGHPWRANDIVWVIRYRVISGVPS